MSKALAEGAVDWAPPTGAPVLRTERLTKRYGRVLAVDGLDLEVHEGDLFGFLGPNGSGKTTTVRMLLGLVFANSGRIELLGRSMPRHARQILPNVGAVIEGPAFYPHLSGRANLALLDAAGPGGGRSDRRARIRTALERVDLGPVARRPVRAYSSGMRQRLALAAALLRGPRLLVLDEPTNGLDPQGMREVRDLLRELVSRGTTVFLSSHLLGEVELTCNRAAIVHRGRLLVQDRVAALLAPTGRVWVDTPDPDAVRRVVGGLAGGGPLPRVDESATGRVAVRLDGLPADALNAALVTAGVRVRELVVERRTLEQAFLELTGRAWDGAASSARPAVDPPPNGEH